MTERRPHYKLVIVGKDNVGKRALTHKYIQTNKEEGLKPPSIDFTQFSIDQLMYEAKTNFKRFFEPVESIYREHQFPGANLQVKREIVGGKEFRFQI